MSKSSVQSKVPDVEQTNSEVRLSGEKKTNVECTYIWRKISDINGITQEEVKQKLFLMYKSRPVLTPINDVNELFSYYPCQITVLCSETNEILGGLMWWQSEFGNKISTSFSKNTDIYKEHIIPRYKELLETPGYYAELSEALEYLIRKQGLDNIKNPDIIKTVLGALIKDEDILNEGDERLLVYKLGRHPSPAGSYLRYIKGVGKERKALYGIPCINKKFIGDGCDRICNITNMGGKKKRKRKTIRGKKTRKRKRKTYRKKSKKRRRTRRRKRVYRRRSRRR